MRHLALLALFPLAGLAQPQVHHLPTTALVGEREVIVRGAFEVDGPPHRWYGVYVQLRRGAARGLRFGGARDALVHWGNLFSPARPRRARWTDCRVAIRFEQLSQLGLAAGRHTIWAVCDVRDEASKRWLGSGWETRTPLLVTIDADGRATRVELFDTPAVPLARSDARARVPSLRVTLGLEALKLREGATLVRRVDVKQVVSHALLRDGRQARLRDHSRGAFFAPIDSAAKARELVALGHLGARQVDPAQLERWRRAAGELLAPCPFAHAGVRAEGQLGWRVDLLLWTPRGELLALRACVGRDGRIGERRTVCLRLPAGRTSAAAGQAAPDADGARRAAALGPLIAALPPLLPAAALRLTDEPRRAAPPAGEGGGDYLEPRDWSPAARR